MVAATEDATTGEHGESEEASEGNTYEVVSNTPPYYLPQHGYCQTLLALKENALVPFDQENLSKYPQIHLLADQVLLYHYKT